MRRILALLVLLVAGVAVWLSGGPERFTLEAVQEAVAAAGVFGPLLFVLLFALAELVHVPAVIFLVGAGVLWPLHVALPTALAGAVAAACLVFAVARTTLGASVQRHLPEALRRYDERLARQGLRTVIAVRLTTFMLPAMHWVLGFSKVRFRDFLLGTAIGVAPGISAVVIFGEAVTRDWQRALPWLFGGLLLALLARALWRRYREGQRPVLETLPPGTPAAELDREGSHGG